VTTVLFPIKILKSEYLYHRKEYDGLCRFCGSWSFGGAEPDAEHYYCHECENRGVTGAENALLMGLIEIK